MFNLDQVASLRTLDKFLSEKLTWTFGSERERERDREREIEREREFYRSFIHTYTEITISGRISSKDFCFSSFTSKSPSTGIIYNKASQMRRKKLTLSTQNYQIIHSENTT